MIWPFVIGGSVLAIICAYGVWWLVVLLLKGILTNSWPMIIGGGILMYISIGILFVGIVIGLIGFVVGVLDE